MKTLGRNAEGSETLYSATHLSTLLFHTSLLRPSYKSPSFHISPRPWSLAALEALRIIANLLVLHAVARDHFAHAGGLQAVAQALAGRGHITGHVDRGGIHIDALFLLGRIGFLITIERPKAVQDMVDEEDLVNSLVYVST